MNRRFLRVRLPLLLILFAAAIVGLPVADAALSDEQEKRAQRLGNGLRCVVCSSETVQESPAELAADMRRLIRNKIELGESDDEILRWLRARYGDSILMKPPFAVRTYALWLLPLLFLLGGWLLARHLIKK